MYTAEPTTPSEQRSYLIIGVIGIVLVGVLIFVATLVS